MKKILLAGFIILIAAFVVTCDEAPIAEEEIEYTDVVYSPDGSQVTVYLDGAKVPVTKAQRAMTRDLAMMSYDFLEVIFKSGSYIARNSWDLGAPAGISGVQRNNTTDYSELANACLFAGKKDGKILFGIGRITKAVDDKGADTMPNVTAATASVTFEVRAILTGLKVVASKETIDRGVVFDSLDYDASANSTYTGFTARTADNTDLVEFGGVKYPIYNLPPKQISTIKMNYKFSNVGADTDTWGATKIDGTPLVQRRTPRFMDSGSYREPKNLVNTRTTVKIDATYFTSATVGSDFDPVVPLIFDTPTASASGIFSFYLKIPVYMVDKTFPTGSSNVDKGGTAAITWYICTGYGSELYSIDDGASNGGCALIGLGITGGGDWLTIDWDWTPYP